MDEARMKEIFQKFGNVVSVKLAREAWSAAGKLRGAISTPAIKEWTVRSWRKGGWFAIFRKHSQGLIHNLTSKKATMTVWS